MTAYTRPDPARPYKAIAAAAVPAVLAALVAILENPGRDLLPPWALLLLAGVVAGLATYRVPNPVKAPRGEAGESAVLVLIAVAVAVIALVLLFGIQADASSWPKHP